MNFEHTEERRMRSDSVNRFISEQYTFEVRNTLQRDKLGMNPAIWQQLADIGVLAALFREEDGGLGGAGFDLAVVFEALGRGLVVEPVLGSAVLAGEAIAVAGNEKQRALLDDIISGNLVTATISTTQNNDFLGYVNVLTNTGTGSGNAIQSLSSLAFYAQGANVSAGLGGNIALFTAPDQTGSQGFLRMRQAVGIENDQSFRTFGAFKTGGNIIEGGTYVTTFVTTPGVYNNFVANTAISTVIIDSAGSAAVPLANIVLPSTPADRQRIKIVAVAPITSANVYAGVTPIKYVPTTKFSSGNVTVQLTYMAGQSTWYLS